MPVLLYLVFNIYSIVIFVAFHLLFIPDTRKRMSISLVTFEVRELLVDFSLYLNNCIYNI